MRISVDHRGGHTYVYLGPPDRAVAYTRFLTGLNVDYDEHGAIVGLEVFALPEAGVIDLDAGTITI